MVSILDLQRAHYNNGSDEEVAAAPPMLPHGDDPQAVRPKKRRGVRRKGEGKAGTAGQPLPVLRPAPIQPGTRVLPASDLPAGFPPELAFRALAAYGTIRTLSLPLRLSPFTPNVFLRALHLPFPNRLLGQIHVALLRILLSHLQMGYHWNTDTPDVRKKRKVDGIRWPLRAGDSLALLDTYTWPVFYDDYCHLTADQIHAALCDETDFVDLKNLDLTGVEDILPDQFRSSSYQVQAQNHGLSALYAEEEPEEETKSDDGGGEHEDGDDADFEIRRPKKRRRKRRKSDSSNSKQHSAPPPPPMPPVHPMGHAMVASQQLRQQMTGYQSRQFGTWSTTGPSTQRPLILPSTGGLLPAGPPRPPPPAPRTLENAGIRRSGSMPGRMPTMMPPPPPPLGTSFGPSSRLPPPPPGAYLRYPNNAGSCPGGPRLLPPPMHNGSIVNGSHRPAFLLPRLANNGTPTKVVRTATENKVSSSRSSGPVGSTKINGGGTSTVQQFGRTAQNGLQGASGRGVIGRKKASNDATTPRATTTWGRYANDATAPRTEGKPAGVTSSLLPPTAVASPANNTAGSSSVAASNSVGSPPTHSQRGIIEGSLEIVKPSKKRSIQGPHDRLGDSPGPSDPYTIVQSFIKGEKLPDTGHRPASNKMEAKYEEKSNEDSSTDSAPKKSAAMWPHFAPIAAMRTGSPYHRLPMEQKIDMLEFLLDELLSIDTIAAELSQRHVSTSCCYPFLYGRLPDEAELKDLENEDECAVCRNEGDLICCDGCISSYHKQCLCIPEERELPGGRWLCPECSVRDPAIFGPLRSGQKSSLDWFTVEDLDQAERYQSHLSHMQNGDSFEGQTGAGPTSALPVSVPNDSFCVDDSTKSPEFLVVHGFVFRRNRGVANRDARLPMLPLKSSDLRNQLVELGSDVLTRWPMKQVPYEPALLRNNLLLGESRSYFCTKERYDPSFYMSEYRKAPLPRLVRQFGEPDLCEYEIRCAPVTTHRISGLLSNDMSNDAAVAESLRSRSLLFDPCEMIATYLSKLEDDLFKASLLDVSWRTKYICDEGSWSVSLAKSFSVRRLSARLLELVDATHPRAFNESWFLSTKSASLESGDAKPETQQFPFSKDLNPKDESLRRHWERSSPSSIPTLVAKRFVSLSDWISRIRPDLEPSGSRVGKRKPVDRVAQNIDRMASVVASQNNEQGRLHLANNDANVDEMKNGGQPKDAAAATERSADESPGDPQITENLRKRSDRGQHWNSPVIETIEIHERTKISELVKELESPIVPEEFWPCAGRRLFEPTGYLPQSTVRRLGRNAGCVVAPFVTYSPLYEVGQVSYGHVWRKRVSQCTSFEELLTLTRALESCLDHDIICKCFTITNRYRIRNIELASEIVYTQRDLRTGSDYHLVVKFSKSHGRWVSSMDIALPPLVLERVRRRKSWAKKMSERKVPSRLAQLRDSCDAPSARKLNSSQSDALTEGGKSLLATVDRKLESAGGRNVAGEVRPPSTSSLKPADAKVKFGPDQAGGTSGGPVRQLSKQKFGANGGISGESNLTETNLTDRVLAQHKNGMKRLIRLYGASSIPLGELNAMREQSQKLWFNTFQTDKGTYRVLAMFMKTETDAIMEAAKEKYVSVKSDDSGIRFKTPVASQTGSSSAVAGPVLNHSIELNGVDTLPTAAPVSASVCDQSRLGLTDDTKPSAQAPGPSADALHLLSNPDIGRGLVANMVSSQALLESTPIRDDVVARNLAKLSSNKVISLHKFDVKALVQKYGTLSPAKLQEIRDKNQKLLAMAFRMERRAPSFELDTVLMRAERDVLGEAARDKTQPPATRRSTNTAHCPSSKTKKREAPTGSGAVSQNTPMSHQKRPKKSPPSAGNSSTRSGQSQSVGSVHSSHPAEDRSRPTSKQLLAMHKAGVKELIRKFGLRLPMNEVSGLRQTRELMLFSALSREGTRPAYVSLNAMFSNAEAEAIDEEAKQAVFACGSAQTFNGWSSEPDYSFVKYSQDRPSDFGSLVTSTPGKISVVPTQGHSSPLSAKIMRMPLLSPEEPDLGGSSNATKGCVMKELLEQQNAVIRNHGHIFQEIPYLGVPPPDLAPNGQLPGTARGQVAAVDHGSQQLAEMGGYFPSFHPTPFPGSQTLHSGLVMPAFGGMTMSGRQPHSQEMPLYGRENSNERTFLQQQNPAGPFDPFEHSMGDPRYARFS